MSVRFILAAAAVLLLGFALPAAVAVWTVPERAARGGAPAFAGETADFSLFDSPRPAPEVAVAGPGGEGSLADFRGRVVLLNLWATWCAPCVAEMPSLDRLQARLGGPNFEVVALSLDAGGEAAVRPFYEANGIGHLAVYTGRMAGASALGAPGLPSSYLIDREGRILGSLAGAAHWDSPEAEEFLRAFIGP